MGLANNTELGNEQKGLIPRTVEELFYVLGTYSNDVHCKVTVTFVEIYQEQFRDLLCPETDSKRIILREKEGTQCLAGVQEVQVFNEKDIGELLELGTRNRSIGDTLMNQQSSRSHAIFTISLEKTMFLKGGAGASITKKSKFQLVDLAGSERMDKTGAEGVRLKESVKINTGLLVLGKVISILGDNNPDKDHVPYRDSKLTRLLQDSLGGTSQTVMIACISPLAKDLTETVSTLMYADRAKNIKNHPIMHIAHNNEQIEILEELEMFIDRLKAKGKFTPEMANYTTPHWIQYMMTELEDSQAISLELVIAIDLEIQDGDLRKGK
ncbi:hypothetical protein HK103_003609 [Boothiomyces macroporosus]|uniref:Kinesin-like protein n=1 Tax=Boothiomyces macroporosus TaxID=261099 RepID=A0AAD5Y906_9FUNG|nr:hypothetical protein HK103_003609 [Boothiomyces macroporosus]